jgi:hypothetical protein
MKKTIFATRNDSRFVWVVKLDASGNIQWENHIISNAACAVDMVQTPDGGFFVVTCA